VPEEGLEPPLPCDNEILSLARLPVPPFRPTHILLAELISRQCVHFAALARKTETQQTDSKQNEKAEEES
jgi:hypothetical protein